jgi:phenylpyruvate tautomerase PptA (4-oxalocrotonate tautomerase family)
MPLVTVTVRKPKTTAFKAGVLKAVHAALVAAGVPEKDRFHRVLELSADDFQYDDTYPDATKPRDNDFVLIEIVLSAGRSVKVKRQVLADIVKGIARDPGVDAENVFVVFKETTWENWAFAGGRQIHV